jgi:sporulation protein YlmC with PRC-barrel domain
MAERQAGSMLETRPRPEETVDLMRAHDIRDIKVRNPEGENLGDLTDIAIDRESGRIAYAILAYGGILGFGEKHFAIPWEAVRARSKEKVAVVDIDKRTLDSAPGFSRDRMPREGDWNLIRTPPTHGATEPSPPVTERELPPSREEKPAAPAESTLPARERVVPVPPAVQTVAGGWGGQPTGQRAEERPAREVVTTERVEARETRTEEVRPVSEAEQPLTARGPSRGHLSAADLQVYLKGMDYPAGKQDLITHARERNAPESVIVTLEEFSDRTYRSAADVSVEFGKETRGEPPTGAETRTQETVVEEIHEERPEARRRAPSHGHLSAADLQVYLKGMDYPAGRQDLITHARERDAPESVIVTLEEFSDRTYRSAADVSAEFGNAR